MKPTIGILGGCGPLATLDIEYKIFKAMQRLLHPLVDQDYFNVIVFNYTQYSDRNDSIIFNQKTPLTGYLKSVQTLTSFGVNVLLLACQTAHLYLPELQKSTSVPIIDIVQETVKFIEHSFSPLAKVGLLSTEATKEKRLYQMALAPYHIEVVTISTEIQKKLMEAIYIIKTGVGLIDGIKELDNNHYSMLNQERYSEFKKHPYRHVLVERTFSNPIETIKEAINYLTSKGCEQVILGCTELPLILPHIDLKKINVDLIDPNAIVAESLVSVADKIGKKKTDICRPNNKIAAKDFALN